MDEQGLIIKPKKKFAIGGIFCIITGLVSGAFSFLNFFEYAYDVFSVIRSMSYGRDVFDVIFDYLGFRYWSGVLITTAGYAASGISMLLLIVLGIMLLCKVHKNRLAIIPIALIVLMLPSAFSTAYAVLYYINAIASEGYPIILAISGLVFESAEIPSLFLRFLGWLLLTVAIFANCKRERTAEDKGRFKALIFIIPAFFVLASVMSFGNTVLYQAQAFIPELNRYYYFGAFYEVIIDLLISLITSGTTAVLYAVTLGLVTSWIINPYKKNKEDDE